MDELNGNGVYHNDWQPLKLPDSGVTIECRRVSHGLLYDAQRSVRKPAPPIVDVNYNGNVKQEPNPNAPEHLEALRTYEAERANKALETAVILGVRVVVDKELVNEYRQSLVESGIDLPRNDKVLYVTRILCETNKDLQVLQENLIRKSQPTEGAVAEATERFRPEVQES